MKKRFTSAVIVMCISAVFILNTGVDLAYATETKPAPEGAFDKPKEEGEPPEDSMAGNINASATSVDTGVYLRWDAVENATSYRICKLVDGKFVVISELGCDASHFNDTEVVDGETYIYGIVAGTEDKGPKDKLTNYKILTITYKEKEKNEVTIDEDNTKVQLNLEKNSESEIEITEEVNSLEETVSSDALTENSQNVSSEEASTAQTEYDRFANLVNLRMENLSYDYIIEADVKLAGSGSGYHAKIVMGTPQSAVSFGIQYDAGAIAPYTGKTVALLENIQSNYNGQQKYVRFAELEKSRTYRLMLGLNQNGHGEVYVNGQSVGTFENPYVVSSGEIDMWVEGAARLNGDYVSANFSNVRARKHGVTAYGTKGEIVDDSTRANGIKCYSSNGVNELTNEALSMTVIAGSVHGIGDWDSSFNNASSLAHIKFE
ncbi:MAG: hypothetical protein K6F37_09630 [Lachnospiraceae bacterium]|nr:hypothetical protein [Lachnospiraceae bacterium]